mgnify:CR=1 FL=1
MLNCSRKMGSIFRLPFWPVFSALFVSMRKMGSILSPRLYRFFHPFYVHSKLQLPKPLGEGARIYWLPIVKFFPENSLNRLFYVCAGSLHLFCACSDLELLKPLMGKGLRYTSSPILAVISVSFTFFLFVRTSNPNNLQGEISVDISTFPISYIYVKVAQSFVLRL